MKLALLADIHANLEALTACLAHAREQQAERYAFLGDLVGYGADPAAVVDKVAELVGQGALAVRGNHDVAALAGQSDTMNKIAEEAIAWTRARLSDAQRAFLAGLPLVAKEGSICLVHASADAPSQWIYVSDPARAARSLEASGATYVFSGHVHEPALYFSSQGGRPVPFRPVPGVPIPVPPHRRWLAIPGAVGQPRDGNTAACYALLDTARSTLTFFRVPYDWHAAAAKVRGAGLPARLAQRLSHGG